MIVSFPFSGYGPESRLTATVKSTKERHNLLVSVREMMSSLGLENKKQLCFGYGEDQGRCLNYSEVYVIGMALDSLNGKSCIAILVLVTLTLMN